MDKITRMLILYSRLIRGEELNKTMFCFETNCSPRTFDRDIEDIRLFLSESFSLMELTYDRGKNSYFIAGTKKIELESMEYLFIERILRDTAVLRKDEFSVLTKHLRLNTENVSERENNLLDDITDYKSPLHNKALLKMHSDLVSIMRQKKTITMKYFKNGGEVVERNIIPCIVKYDMGYLYLIAYRDKSGDKYPAYYRLDRIYSFNILRDQTVIEQKMVKMFIDNYSHGITQMYGGEYVEVVIKCKKSFYSYVFDKFRDVEIIEQNAESMTVSFWTFEEGFIKWFIGQPQDMMLVQQPDSTKKKLVVEAQKIIRKYGGRG